MSARPAIHSPDEYVVADEGVGDVLLRLLGGDVHPRQTAVLPDHAQHARERRSVFLDCACARGAE